MKIGKLEIRGPWSNPGVVSMKWGERFYADVFVSPYLGLYVNDRITRRWYKLATLRLLRVQVVDPENAARIFRRTMKPYAILHDLNRLFPVEVVSYPFVENGDVRVMIRATPGDPTSLMEAKATFLRPINFQCLPTRIPANDPI